MNRLALYFALLPTIAHALQGGQDTRMPERMRAEHVLNRLAFGPRPGDVDRVMRMGVDRWIEAQLDPAALPDTIGTRAMAGCGLWTDPLDVALTRPLAAMGAAPAIMITHGVVSVGASVLPDDVAGCRLTRSEWSERQLLEVMTDFWENHFSVFRQKARSWGAVIQYERGAILPNALGRFRDLLGAVAHSPAMLTYLDNAGSTRVARNENFARELLELHTLGVDGGYTQTDVVEVARAFTGWSHNVPPSRVVPRGTRSVETVPAIRFAFDSAGHDADAKVVLGRALSAGRGVADGDEVLDLLARHPSTARHIARKLVVRFVSDDPPPALVDRVAATFVRSDGDIREMMRTIIASDEFNARSAFRSKVKRPIELVLSLRRGLDATVDMESEQVRLLDSLHQPLWGRVAPDGWPETGAPWMNVDAIRARIALVSRIARDEIPSIRIRVWGEWAPVAKQPFAAQVDAVVNHFLGGQASSETRQAMLAVEKSISKPADIDARQHRLRDLIALALASPEYQRR